MVSKCKVRTASSKHARSRIKKMQCVGDRNFGQIHQDSLAPCFDSWKTSMGERHNSKHSEWQIVPFPILEGHSPPTLHEVSYELHVVEFPCFGSS